MSEDLKLDQPGPEEQKRVSAAIPDDTEGHRKKMPQVTGEPDGGPDEMKHKMPLGIPDSDDDTEGHKK
jgi:hypothetical protein